MSSAREATNHQDAQSEAMSTSTISRAEDTQRMKELEDTFEERYMKVRFLLSFLVLLLFFGEGKVFHMFCYLLLIVFHS